MKRVKGVWIDRHNREEGTYTLRVQEVELDTDLEDVGDIGLAIHDDEYGEKDKRWYFKVIGIEDI